MKRDLVGYKKFRCNIRLIPRTYFYPSCPSENRFRDDICMEQQIFRMVVIWNSRHVWCDKKIIQKIEMNETKFDTKHNQSWNAHIVLTA